MTARFATEWENEANRVLKSSREQYVNSIVVVDEGFAKGAVMLLGDVPNMVEQGVEPFDMKPGMLDGPNAKVGKDGSKYNTVPFSFGIPTSLKSNFSSIMPQEVHSVISKKPVDKVTGVSKPLSDKELPKKLQQPQVKRVKLPDSKSFKEYQHKSSIYEGMTKRQDKRTGQNSYGSFRRVSENSDPNSWLHPGIEEKDISGSVISNFNIQGETSAIFDKWWSENKK